MVIFDKILAFSLKNRLFFGIFSPNQARLAVRGRLKPVQRTARLTHGQRASSRKGILRRAYIFFAL
ncbi:MAG: hypothetical protein EOM12_16010 [Verrucomicrobiae bacterium]|nr:hypothetical protein [Verrucomicrobiae bacterium]